MFFHHLPSCFTTKKANVKQREMRKKLYSIRHASVLSKATFNEAKGQLVLAWFACLPFSVHAVFDFVHF